MPNVNDFIRAGLGYHDAILAAWPDYEKSAFTDKECEWVWQYSPNPRESSEAWNIRLSRAKAFKQLVDLWSLVSPGDDLEGERCWDLSLTRYQERFDVWNALKASAVNFDQMLFLLKKAKDHVGEIRCLWNEIDPDQAETSEQRKAYWRLDPEINSEKRTKKLNTLHDAKNKNWKHWLHIWEMYDSNTMGESEAWRELSKMATTHEEKVWLVEHAPDFGYKDKAIQELRHMTES